MKLAGYSVTILLTIPLICANPNVLFINEPWYKELHDETTSQPQSQERLAWIATIQRAIPSLDTIIHQPLDSNHKVSTECQADMTLYQTGIKNADLWAMTMFDASAKVPESLLSGAYYFFGNFDQCLSMKKEDYNTKYSAVSNGVVVLITSLKPNSTFSLFFILNVCMPETCSPADVKEIFFNMLFLPLLSVGAFPVIYTPQSLVYTGEDKPALDASAIVVIVIFSILVSLVGVTTLYDLYGKKMELLKGQIREIVLTFSVARNFPKMMEMKHPPSSITCLHGLRVLSLFWVILGHRYVNYISGFVMNKTTFDAMYEDVMAAVLYNGYPAVDTFFFISGFLMCFLFLIDMSKKRSFNIFVFYIYRYIRLTAPLALTVAFYAGLLKHIGYGPVWRLVTSTPDRVCKNYWYLTILYLNNYIWPDPGSFNFCIEQTWYLSVDMQLAWLSPLVLIPLWKWPKQTSQLMLPLLIAASCFVPFTSTYINEFPMITNQNIDVDKQMRYFTDMYIPTHMRATSYLMGIAFAYFYFKIQNTKINLNWWQVAICWCVSTGIGLTVIFAGAIVFDPNYVYNAVGAAFYAGFHRLAWSICLSWIIFACTRGYAGVVNKILSWQGWLPLSRISYCAYLTHFITYYYQGGHIKINNYFSHFGAVHAFLGDVMFVILGPATLLYICCEAPTLNLLKSFMKNRKTEESEKKNLENSN